MTHKEQPSRRNRCALSLSAVIQRPEQHWSAARPSVLRDAPVETEPREWGCPHCESRPQVDRCGPLVRIECGHCYTHTDWEPTEALAWSRWRSYTWRRGQR
jgi:hypothetical protein